MKRSQVTLTAVTTFTLGILLGIPSVATAQITCTDPLVIDFEQAPPGTIVTDQLTATGVSLVSALNATPGDPDKVLIFDSSDPTGNDDDLGTPNEEFGGPGEGEGDGNSVPLGNILIVAEDDEDSNGDGLVDDPDDSARGGDVLFNFTAPVQVLSVKLVDVETSGVYLAGYAKNSLSTFTVEVAGSTGNSVQTIDLASTPQEPSARLLVTLRESSGIGEIVVCPTSETAKLRTLRIESACRKRNKRRARRIGKRRLRRAGKGIRSLLSKHGKKRLLRGRCG